MTKQIENLTAQIEQWLLEYRECEDNEQAKAIMAQVKKLQEKREALRLANAKKLGRGENER